MPSGSTGWGGTADEQHADVLAGPVYREDVGGVHRRGRQCDWVPRDQVDHRPEDETGVCYLTRESRWIGVLEIISEPFMDHTPIWEDEVFPCRVKVKLVEALTPDASVPIHDLLPRMKTTKDLAHPQSWTGYSRGSPANGMPLMVN